MSKSCCQRRNSCNDAVRTVGAQLSEKTYMEGREGGREGVSERESERERASEQIQNYE